MYERDYSQIMTINKNAIAGDFQAIYEFLRVTKFLLMRQLLREVEAYHEI